MDSICWKVLTLLKGFSILNAFCRHSRTGRVKNKKGLAGNTTPITSE